MTPRTIKIKIYYEDTDAAGVVYYANYLRYLERARTEFLLEKGIDVAEYHNKGFLFAVIIQVQLILTTPGFPISPSTEYLYSWNNPIAHKFVIRCWVMKEVVNTDSSLHIDRYKTIWSDI